MRTLVAVVLCWAGMATAQPHKGSTSTFQHAHFSLEVPKGWLPAKWTPQNEVQRFVPILAQEEIKDASVVHFADSNGNFFSVYVNPGTEMEADAVWTIEARADGSSIRINDEGAMCKVIPGSEGPCSAGNGSLEIVTMPALELRGRWYTFRFGNTRRETEVPLAPFRQMLRSFRAY